jgi:hypothetical protein
MCSFQAESELPAKRLKDSSKKLKATRSSPKSKRTRRKTKLEPPSPNKPVKLEPPSSPPLLAKRTPTAKPVPPPLVKKIPKTKLAPSAPQRAAVVPPLQPPTRVEPRCPFPLLRLENPTLTHCFFNATVQLLRVLPEANVFFRRAHLIVPASAQDRLGWARDLGKLIAEEGTGRQGAVAGMRAKPYFPSQLREGQQDACELLNLIIDLKNERTETAQTLAQQLFSFEWEAVRVCSACNQVSTPSVVE